MSLSGSHAFYTRAFYKSFFDYIRSKNKKEQEKEKKGENISCKPFDFSSYGKYIDQKISKDIQQRINNRSSPSLTFCQSRTIHFVHEFDEKERGKEKVETVVTLTVTGFETENDLNETMDQIELVVRVYFSFVRALKISRVTTHLHITCFLTHFEKKLPDRKEDPLTPFHVNSGLTYFTNPIQIILFRKEEVQKVLIHELTHYFEIEQRIPISPSLISFIQERFGISNDPRLPEAVTDFWACYVNVLLSSCFDLQLFLLNGKGKGKEKENKIKFQSITDSKLKYEIDFIVKQASKVASHTDGCLSFTIDSKNERRKKREKKNEETHVIAYYIVKAIMFMSFQKYLNLFYKYTKQNPKQGSSRVSNEIQKDLELQMPRICQNLPSFRSLQTSLRMSSS